MSIKESFIVVFLVICGTLSAQTTYMEHIKKQGGSRTTVPDSDWMGKNAIDVVQDAARFLNDAEKVAKRAVELIGIAATHSTDTTARRIATTHLVIALKSESTLIASSANSYLSKFAPEDFTAEAQSIITGMLENLNSYNYERVARMAASKGVGLNALSQVFLTKKMNIEKKWDIALALSRLGDEYAINWIVKKLSRANNQLYVIEVAKDLVYTRQPKILDLCVEALKNPDLLCDCVNPNVSQKIDCGYRLMEKIGPLIKDFPVTFNSLGMLGSDAEYEAALKRVRQWLNERERVEYLL